MYTDVCSVNSADQFEILKPFLYNDPKTGKQKFYSSIDTITNTYVPDFALPSNVHFTKGNGFCEKGVYKSWSKCNEIGNCYAACNDGLCHEEYASNAPQIAVLPGSACVDYQLKCAKQCAEDDRCVAFSFKKIHEVDHRPVIVCNLMTGTLCPTDELVFRDPKVTYHVKGSFIEGLFGRLDVSTTDELDDLITTNDALKNGHWGSWSKCQANEDGGALCGDGKNVR